MCPRIDPWGTPRLIFCLEDLLKQKRVQLLLAVPQLLRPSKFKNFHRPFSYQRAQNCWKYPATSHSPKHVVINGSSIEFWHAGKEVPKVTHFEVDISVLIHVKSSENVIAELFRVAGGEEHLVHVYEFGGCQSTIGAVLLKRKFHLE